MKKDPEAFLKEEMTKLRHDNLEWVIRHLEAGSKPPGEASVKS